MEYFINCGKQRLQNRKVNNTFLREKQCKCTITVLALKFIAIYKGKLEKLIITSWNLCLNLQKHLNCGITYAKPCRVSKLDLP